MNEEVFNKNFPACQGGTDYFARNNQGWLFSGFANCKICTTLPIAKPLGNPTLSYVKEWKYY